MFMPLFSIIIPIYNVEKYIEECFDSILRQAATDIEIICVDDGSTDNSGNICDKYAQADNRFIIFHQKNLGVAAARNRGLAISRGKYVAWIDPDDYISDNWYSAIKQSIAFYSFDILVFDYKIIKNGKIREKRYREKSQFIDKDIFLRDVAEDVIIQSQLWQKIFKRELFNEILFPENFQCMEDYAVLHKMIEKVESVYYLQECLYFYRVRQDGLVMEIDLKKSYDCYLIASARYEYLASKYNKISRMGKLMQALGFCIQFNKSSLVSRRGYENKYESLCKLIDDNISEILCCKSISILLKIKFLCAYLRILEKSIFLHNFLKGMI